MIDKDVHLEEIRKKKREVDKFKHSRIRDVVDEVEPLYQAIKDECPHEYKSSISERVFGYLNVRSCFHCGDEQTN